jgi:uncharacterized membrane protein YfcA
MEWKQYVVLFGAAAIGGAVNSVAGGGTILTFPLLLYAGINPVVANATSTVALWPGQLGSLWGYRKEIGRSRRAIGFMAVPSLAGGCIVAVLLLVTPPNLFARLVPYLILMATGLFMAQEPLARYQRARAAQTTQDTGDPVETQGPNDKHLRAWAGILVYQLFVAIYGGYFGAGIGILMLAALGFMGFANIHQANGLKNINGLCINAVAAAIFIGRALVDWRIALFMAVAAISGGYFGAGTARRIGQRNVRRIVVLIGIGLAVFLFFWKQQPQPKAQPAHTSTQRRAEKDSL